MVKYVKSNKGAKQITASSVYNIPINDTQSKAYQRAESVYKQHKMLIDRLANK